MSRYNLTHLSIDQAAERGIVHRDYLAHCLRWSHVLKHARVGMNVLDVGCGPEMPMASVFYVNRYKPAYYVGIDLRTARPKTDVNFPWQWVGGDVTLWRTFEEALDYMEGAPHIITCLEVIEHMPHDDGRKLLDNLKLAMGNNTVLFLSTPCFNGSAAGNHTAMDGTPMEWTYEDLRDELKARFDVYAQWGTFISQGDLKDVMSEEELTVWSALREYYDSNVLAVLLAPLHPAQARNVIWHLRRKS